MIKKIIAWITGKTESPAPAPYKVETPTVTVESATGTVTALPAGTEATNSWPFPTYKEITPAPKTEVVQVEQAAEEKPAKKARKIPANAVETAPVSVSAKYAQADLKKMTKAELSDLAAKHSLEVKSRATKDELIAVLSKV
jgi:hypothetical protein